MTYGYGYLNAPLAGPNDPDAMISTCTLQGIGRYLCPLSNGDPWRCLDCVGIRSCTTGQRAVVLLDEATKTAAEKPQEPPRKQGRGKLDERRHQMADAARERYKAALANGDPKRYMVEVLGLSPGSVKTTMARWRKQFPDVEAEKHEEGNNMDNEDTISLEELLRQHNYIVSDPEPEIIGEDLRSPEQDLAELLRQEAALLDQIAELRAQVRGIREQRERIKEVLAE